jgi:glutamyl-tRNA synthetase
LESESDFLTFLYYPQHSSSVANVRVRFAPSPTGYLHVGGLRTALYNYLFARKHKGVFVLRIEDTDRTRLVEGAVENLLQTLRWAGLDFDEGPGKGGEAGPYVQSERLPLYRKHVQDLVASGAAYYAFETPEELEEMKEAQKKANAPQRYDRRALRLAPEEVRKRVDAGVPSVIRMKVPEQATIRVDDIVRGRVEFSGDQVDDQVLLKSDGYPTYHLANVVDDHLMGITHVIRGEEWLSSTPKHVLLYQSFGWDPPQFAHLPLLLNPDRSKLSKRQGDVAVEEYREKGVLPEALLNFVALLGWNPGDERELFSVQELTEIFSLERVGKSGAVFTIAKLDSINGQYIRTIPEEDLVRRVRPLLEQAGYSGFTDGYLTQVVRLLRERAVRLGDIVAKSGYFFKDPETYDEQAKKKNWRPESRTQLENLRPALTSLTTFTPKELEEEVRHLAEREGVSAGKIIHALRLATTGGAEGPGLFELMSVIGREACLRRLARALEVL